jgi:hypothetical protein
MIFFSSEVLFSFFSEVDAMELIEFRKVKNPKP